MGAETSAVRSSADTNWRFFVAFRVFFNARFYYPVFAVLFLDYGLTIEQFTILNTVWAVAIVCVDLPAGALADHIGRRPLVVTAAICMVLEMALLAFVPLGHPTLLFWVFFLNRIISGTAEGCASGADEALVFDSLAEQNRSDEWPRVLDQVIRWQSVGFVVAMLAGGAIYDPGLMQKVCDALGIHAHLTQQITMRFPIYLNLITAALTLYVALRMREPQKHATHTEMPTNPLRLIVTGGRWILATPLVLLIIVAGFLHDSVIRLFMTFGASYYRLIALPSKYFGLIGAAMGMLGFIVSPLARRMVEKRTYLFNFCVMVLLTLVGLAGVAMHYRYWGLLFAVPLGVAMSLLNFFISYYVNAMAESGQRATILSFKGLAFNLGYGFVGLLFAVLLRTIRDHDHLTNSEEIFARASFWIPVYFAATIVLLVLIGGPMLRRSRAKDKA